ncbi:hypothetical protein H2248_003575 [Termitomyces sp. 'cryptogamus']|nr:hypothetical protein H2248_003575 [Termitomyces sp. 'cryptogamus']
MSRCQYFQQARISHNLNDLIFLTLQLRMSEMEEKRSDFGSRLNVEDPETWSLYLRCSFTRIKSASYPDSALVRSLLQASATQREPVHNSMPSANDSDQI